MKTPVAIVIVCAFYAAVASADTVVTGASVITMRDGPLAEQRDLYIRDGVFTEAIADPDHAVDFAGKYIIPGLTEMHAHVPVQRPYRDDVLFLWVANGVTTARGMLGHPSHLELRTELANHTVTGPRLMTSGPSFSGGSISSATQAQRLVAEQKAAGYDFLKIHPGMRAGHFEAMVGAARSADIPFAGHITATVGLEASLRAGQQTIDHADGYVSALVRDLKPEENVGFFGSAVYQRADFSRLPELVSLTKQMGAAVVPTETLLENTSNAHQLDAMMQRPQFKYLPKRLQDGYVRSIRGFARSTTPAQGAAFMKARKRLIKALHDGGATILLGSDSPQIFNVPGFSIHRELAAMVRAGLTPYEALRTGTAIPAEFLGQADQWGTIAAGLAADAIVLDANPLDDIDNTKKIHAVLYRGQWLMRDAIDARLAEIADRG